MYLTLAKWVGGLLGGLALAWIVYAGLIRPTTKPNPSTKQEATNMYNYSYYPKVGIGCIRMQTLKDQIYDASAPSGAISKEKK